MYVLKLVPTVLVNGQNAGIHERGCPLKHFRVPTLLSTLQNAPLSKYTKFGSSKQGERGKPKGSLRMLCDAPVHENTAFSGYTVTKSTSVHEIVGSGGQSVKQPEFYVEPKF